jgi:hypothetical protein
VQLTAAPAGSRPTRLTFGPAIAPTGDAFTGQTAVTEAYDTVFARACVRAACGYGSIATGS